MQLAGKKQIHGPNPPPAKQLEIILPQYDNIQKAFDFTLDFNYRGPIIKICLQCD